MDQKTSTTVILIPKTDVLLFSMKEENIVAIPGILSVTIFDQRGKVVFAYEKTVNNEQQNQALFRTFRYIHGQSIRPKRPLRIGLSDELFLCTVSASGDIIGRSESIPRTVLVLFREDRVIWFIGEPNYRISYMKLIDEVLGIHTNIDIVTDCIKKTFVDRYQG